MFNLYFVASAATCINKVAFFIYSILLWECEADFKEWAGHFDVILCADGYGVNVLMIHT